MNNKNPKVEFIAQDGLIEIRYFDTPKDERYRSWKLPLSIADELIAWQQKIKKQKESIFPLKEKTRVCEITMDLIKHIEIKSLDSMGRANMTGWSLPSVVADSLCKWRSISKV